MKRTQESYRKVIPARHVETLPAQLSAIILGCGVDHRRIAAECGIPTSTLAKLAAGRVPMIGPDDAERLREFFALPLEVTVRRAVRQ